MPLFMDVHEIAGGVAMEDVAKAHLADLQTQSAHDVRYLRYWVDEATGRVFCLVEAPSAQAAADVHQGCIAATSCFTTGCCPSSAASACGPSPPPGALTCPAGMPGS